MTLPEIRRTTLVKNNIARAGFLACAVFFLPGVSLHAQQAITSVPGGTTTIPEPTRMPDMPKEKVYSAPQNPSNNTSAMQPNAPAATAPVIPPISASAVAPPDANQLAASAEQAALQAQADAEADRLKRELDHNEKSFNRAEGGIFPLSTDQIHEFMHKLESTEDASVPSYLQPPEPPYDGTPKKEVRIVNLALDPGVEPPQINLASGFVTTVSFIDATGQPWPILDVGFGGSFEISPTSAGSHVVRIMPLARVTTGNLSILLKDLSTPVIFQLAAGGSSVDLRYDVRIPKNGPNVKPELISRPQHLESGNGPIMLILSNLPPESAKRLKLSGLDARTMAWTIDDRMFVRTPLTLLSPAWDASVSSGDGMTVYEMGTTPVLLMSDNGSLLRAHISRDDDHDK